MNPRSKALGALRKLLKQRRETQDMWETLRDFVEPGQWGVPKNALAAGLLKKYIEHEDRAAALVLTAMLEQTLETAISTHLIDLSESDRDLLFDDEGRGPCATFFAKIRIAYSLGVFGPKTRADLGSIQTIRNAFAHTKQHLDFNDEDIVEAVNEFNHVKEFPWEKPFLKPLTTRGLFVETVRHYLVYFAIGQMNKNEPLVYTTYDAGDYFS